MAEYIERDKLLKFKADVYDEDGHVLYAVPTGYIVAMPHDDVAPVVHGRWERIGIKGRKGLPIYPCCSACGTVSAAFRSEWEGLRGPWKYCPNCGCRMDGGADDASV